MYEKAFVEKYLKNNFTFDEAKSEIDFIADILFNYSYKDFILGKTLEQRQLEKLNAVINERIQTRKPVQQIVGQAYFYSRKFFVNENTLIPRPETEILVEKTLEIAKNIAHARILDIGTGSGCIPISLVLENQALTVEAVDISPKALEIAQKNADFHKVSEKINFYRSDLFENVKKKYNIIVSNPPYIPLKDKETLQTEVKDHDPHLALFTSDFDGVEFYEKISEKAGEYLNTDGFLIFEIGINMSEKVANILKRNKFNALEVVSDFNDIERIIISQK